ncbi:Abi family protein [Leuconostoc suionicum]|uniref:Abi family protein n=1 Tax=Leuconostoc suionicum TaxID=1511761 RepID=UPI0019CBFB81|nr:Abi family protein [Leuconostoc suionicum]MBC9720845.1 Abi family protein [Lactobacillus sp.]MDI6498553.1 Abi family protein [Leuconostoc suionicum]MDI6500595.1 Abi family protein [Leuconostoc suionicum]MDI6502753.1 Abi family protein [Leuconostoc suionicum]MDI6613913.1 Abi family protein [Leuconostoc suionicum]
MTDKPFKTISQQIEILKSRNLKFLDEVTAAQHLAAHGYYEIINGYKDTFLDSDNPEIFKNKTTFEDIFALYYLDTKIRNSVMESLLFAESFLKQKLAYTLADQHGELLSQYLSTSVFDAGSQLPHINTRRQLYSQRDLFFNKMHKIADRDYEPFKHYRQDNGNTPPWILIKGMDFGNLRTAIELLKTVDSDLLITRVMDNQLNDTLTQDEIKTTFYELIIMIHKYRNRAAHGGRIYNYYPDVGFTYNSVLYGRLNISREEVLSDGLRKNSIPLLYSALKMLQPNFSAYSLRSGITKAFDGYSKKWEHKRSDVLEQMQADESFINK